MFKCYDGCPNSEFQAYLDEQAKIRKEIESSGATVTYFPMEGKYMAFKNYRPITEFYDTLREVANAISKEEK